MIKTAIVGTLAGVGILLAIPCEAIAIPSPAAAPFQQVEQPLRNKVIVTLGGLSLVGLELWWFIFYKSKVYKASTQGDIQEVTITVDGGYEPSQVVLQAGKTARLNFDRKDPSHCLEEVRIPDFQVSRRLPLNQVTTIEVMPEKAGQYEFTCGMHMFRGVLNVQEK